MAAKKKRSRSAKPSNLAKFRLSGSQADKNRNYQQKAVAAARSKQSQRNHAVEVAKLEPMASPLAELVRDARSGDRHAIWRATELFGNSWRVKRMVAA